MAQAPITTPAPLDLDNIQADIISGLPKKAEVFFFFQIKDGKNKQFCASLGELTKIVTSATQCITDRQKIVKEKERAALHHCAPNILDLVGTNIAFSHAGLLQLGIKDSIGDAVFDAGMLADADGPIDPNNAIKFLNDDVNGFEPAFKNTAALHGVIFITGNSHHSIQKVLSKVKRIFDVGKDSASIVELTEAEGKTRPGKESGHEHFGFLDGVSQPVVAGLGDDANPGPALPGQETIKQGIVLLGRDGDAAATTRPSWAVDGSFLVFRKLKQLVPEFDRFLKAAAPSNPELLGARLVGRWKSGAPVDMSPTVDDPALGADPQRNDNFRYDQTTQQLKCPYAAHTRKTNPRDDLASVGGTEVHRILRRAIQYGPEVTDQEKKSGVSSTDPKLERGLLFVCYQSSIANGFGFLQKNWANNPGFIFNKTETKQPGFDPIIGQAPASVPEPSRFIRSVPTAEGKTTTLPADWVITKGGEYFFSPTISALKNTFVKAV